jgi:hypothetical protein
MLANPLRQFTDSGCGWVRTLALPFLLACFSFSAAGCNFIPDVKYKPQYHNPFPQISKVAVLPFRNQSQEPTLSGARVSMAYYNELQSIRGFEVVPFGVVENQLATFESQVLHHPITTAIDFQQFAKYLGVDAVLQGAITDYEAYYPPRMTMKVNWYAANPAFHPIPVGYGLPWGTKQEKKIPEWVRLESERELAAEQIKTQTPTDTSSSPVEHNENAVESKVVPSSADETPAKIPESISGIPQSIPNRNSILKSIEVEHDPIDEVSASPLPANWPTPQGFIPPSPTTSPPKARLQHDPIISYMRTYNGNDEDFTEALEAYFYFRDDARFGGWQAYLQRSEDFIRFCCHQHIIESLSSRGGQLESRMILRWPINRYER